jgi:hypothetical protein
MGGTKQLWPGQVRPRHCSVGSAASANSAKWGRRREDVRVLDNSRGRNSVLSGNAVVDTWTSTFIWFRKCLQTQRGWKSREEKSPRLNSLLWKFSPKEVHKHSTGKTTNKLKVTTNPSTPRQENCSFHPHLAPGPAGEGGNLLSTASHLIFHQLLPGSRRKPAK